MVLQLWDADVVPTMGQVFTVTNKHWFQGKKKGEMLQLGYQMEFETGDIPKIKSVCLEKEEL